MSKCKCRNCESGNVDRVVKFTDRISCSLCKGTGQVEWIDNVSKEAHQVTEINHDLADMSPKQLEDAFFSMGNVMYNTIMSNARAVDPRQLMYLTEQHFNQMNAMLRNFGFHMHLSVRQDDRYRSDYYRTGRDREIFSLPRDDRRYGHPPTFAYEYDYHEDMTYKNPCAEVFMDSPAQIKIKKEKP